MKKIKIILTIFGIGLIFTLCKQEPQIQKEPEVKIIAKVQFLKGDAYIKRDNVEKPVQINDLLQMKDILITKENTTLDIVLKNKGIIRIAENTQIELQTLSEENIEIHQNSGTVITHLKKLKENENYRISTPTAVAAVRGTSFITKVDEEKNSNFALIHGKIEVKNQKGSSIVIDQPGELTVKKEMDLMKQKIRPLSKESLQLLKELAAQDTGNVQEFVSFVQELKNSSAYKEIELEANYEEKVENVVSNQNKKSIPKTQSAEETVIKRNIKKDPLKIPPSRDFTKE
ncbi:MAG: sigma factor regulatory protein FecR [Patescibacteria group bacterium]|nr:MAG: sigma factor regulatory protein FecR [Patescibacteria group bacterium]